MNNPTIYDALIFFFFDSCIQVEYKIYPAKKKKKFTLIKYEKYPIKIFVA